VSQISPPIRILLAAAVIFLAAWMTVLKPKNDAAPAPAAATPATTPQGNLATGKDAVSAPGKLVQKARDAATTANEQAQAQATGDTSATTPATGAATATKGDTLTPAIPKVDVSTLAGVPAPVVKAISQQKVVVLGILGKQAVDRDVRKALAKIDRWDGRVFVKNVALADVAKYSRVTSGAELDQSPSVVVIDRKLQATTIPGFTDTVSINQAVVDALRASGGLFTSAYLRNVNAVCSQYGTHVLSIAEPSSPREIRPFLQHHVANLSGFIGDVRAIKAPARFKAFRTGFLADAVAMKTLIRDWSVALGKNPTAARFASVTPAFVKHGNVVGKRLDKRITKNHLISCIDG
jgi:hypothetical protein